MPELTPDAPVLSGPLAEVVGEPEEKDLGSLHGEREVLVAQSSAARSLEARFPRRPEGSEAAPTPKPEGEAPTASKGRTAGRVARDAGRGAIETPTQVFGAVMDAINETGAMAREFTNFLADKVGPLANAKVVFDDDGIHFAAGDEAKDVPSVLEALTPEVDEAESMTGGMVRNVSKFIVGFVGAGKLRGVQSLANLGRGGNLTAQMVRGAVADFSVFEPHENRLSNLIEEVPALQNPVTEFLSADPTDSAAEGRFKNAIEGLGLGALTDGLILGVRTLRAARGARAAADAAEAPVRQLIETAETQRGKLTELVGDPKKPTFEIKVPEVDEEGVARALTGDEPTRGEVFVNWSRINTDEDVKEVIQKMADSHVTSVRKAQRGARSWRATRLSAEEIDAWDVLRERGPGEGLNAEQAVAVRELWGRSGKQVRDLARQVQTDPGDLNKIALRKQLAVHNAIQEQVLAARTETARALNAWKIPAGDSVEFAGQMEQMRGLLQTDRTIAEIADRLVALSDAGLVKEADAFVYGSAAAKGAGMIRQLFYFSMLSSPHTHMRNLIGNTSAIPLQMLERKAASLFGKAFGKQNIPDGEASAMVFGMLTGLRNAFRITAKGRRVLDGAARKAVSGDVRGAARAIAENPDDFGTLYRAAATGESGIGINRLELPQQGAFDPERFTKGKLVSRIGLDPDTFGLGADTPLGRVMAFVDTVTTSPMRSLGAADEVFKTTTHGMEISAQAFRKAVREMEGGQITRDQFSDRLTTLVQNPDEQMRAVAESFAKTSTFTNQPLDTPMWQLFNKIQNVPFLGRLTLPFRRTPFNLATFTFQRTPMAPFVRQWQQDIRAGGAAADLAWTKMMVGTGVMLAMADLAIKGDITGQGSDNPAERATKKRMGILPNSVRVGDRYFSYRSLEPISTPIGLSANIVDILKHKDWDDDDVQVDELVIASTMAIAAQVTTQNYMMGISGFIEAMNDPQRYGERWWQRIGSLVVPRGVAMLGRTASIPGVLEKDPTVRMAEDIFDSIKAQTPGMSKTLPAMRDLWGRPISRASGLGDFYDFVSPIYSKKFDPEPIDSELNRLELWLRRPPKKTSFDGVTVNLELHPRIYSRYVELAGNALTHTVHGAPVGLSEKGAKDELNALMKGEHPLSEVYKLMSDGPDGGKANQIRDMVNDYREAARDQLLEEFPELKAQVDLRREQRPSRFDLE